MSVQYTNPPKTAPIAVVINKDLDQVACTDCYVFGPWDKPTELIYPGEVAAWEVPNRCHYCGKTIV